VFAPTNEAFEELAEGTLDALLEDPEGQLTDILRYHVVEGEVLAADVVEADSVETVEGGVITIEASDDGVVLNGTVNVIETDIMASNGVIHVIDAVLMPGAGDAEAMDATEEPTEVAMVDETEEAMDATEEPTEEAMDMTEEPTEEAMEATEEPTEEAMDDMADEMAAAVMVEPGDEVVLGLATTLSGEGLVPFGADIQRGAELALADRPTVTVGGEEFEVSLDVQDDQCNAEGGQAVANRFVSDEDVVAVIGPMCSAACRTAAVIFDREDYTTISGSCTAVDLTAEDTGFESFNRTTPNDDAQGETAAEFIYNELGITRIATIDDSSTYGAGLVEVVTRRFEELGGTVVFSDSITVGDTNFRDLLDNAAAEDPELIYFGGFNAEAARLVEQKIDAGLEDLPFMGADGIWGPEFIDLAGSAAESTYATSPVTAESEEYSAFLTEYEETYNTEPTAAFHAYVYDATNMLLDGIEEVGYIDDNGDLVVERQALADFIRSYGVDDPVEGLSGLISCDGTGECATGGIGIFQVQDGEWSQLNVQEDAMMDAEEPDAEMTEEAMDMTEEPTEEADMEATEEADMEATEEASDS
jgi:branched-chain amino acid transport system substrate-binding protein